MTGKPKPYYRNVKGDFYIEDGCCTACLVPEFYAPDLMSFDESDAHCFVAKQPANDDELYRMIKAARAAELECVRYAGSDRKILRRLAEAGIAGCCDNQSSVHRIKPLLRNHVIFQSSKIKFERDLAQEAENYLLSQNTEYVRFKFSQINADQSGVSFSFSWYQNNFYTVWFRRLEAENFWHIYHSPKYEEAGSKSISIMIDEWLRTSQDFNNIRWFSNKTWKRSLIEWQSTPI